MTEMKVTVDQGLMRELFSEDGGGVQADAEHTHQVLSAQPDEAACAGRYERNEARTSYRSGTRVRTLTLQVPQLRHGSFCPEIFKRYQRSEQAFVLAMMEMVVQGGVHPQSGRHHRGSVRCGDQ